VLVRSPRIMDTPPIATHAPDLARGWTPERKTRFLDHLAAKGNVRAACLRVGLSPEAAYRLRRRDDLFARGWALALALARTRTEQVLADRAIEGVEEPVYYRGELIGSRRRFDARLLLAHLARLDKLVEESEASADFGRFDELLALIAGEQAPAAIVDEETLLPLERDDYTDRAVRRADAEVRYAPSNKPEKEAEEEDWDDPDWGLDDEEEEQLDEEAIYQLEEACEAARTEAREQPNASGTPGAPALTAWSMRCPAGPAPRSRPASPATRSHRRLQRRPPQPLRRLRFHLSGQRQPRQPRSWPKRSPDPSAACPMPSSPRTREPRATKHSARLKAPVGKAPAGAPRRVRLRLRRRSGSPARS